MNAVLMAEIQEARFTPVRLRAGYAMSDVDRLLDELVAALRAGRPIAPLIDGARFTTTQWREAYDEREVDELLARLRATSGDGTAPPAAPTAGAAPPPPAAASTQPHHPDVVAEQRGLLSRVLGRRDR